MSTVRKTRAMSATALYDRCRGFLREMVALGTTTVEAKSGYGLDVRTEMRILAVYLALRRERRARIVATYLGAHVVPPEHRKRRAAYVDLVRKLIPVLAQLGLCRFVDVFVEEGAFTLAEARTILAAARAEGLGTKLHADQLREGGAAALAASVGAVSADHLEHVSPAGITALARAGVVAVSLPIAALYLGKPPMPARALIQAGVPVAVATDFNPGTAPSYHLPFAMTLATTMQKMTAAEALKGATLYAARALALDDRVGSLERGKAADFAIIDAPDEAEWLYHLRPNACLLTAVGGKVQHRGRGFRERG